MKIYITDGTLPSLFTAIFYAIQNPESRITSDSSIQLSLDDQTVVMPTEADKAERVYKKLNAIDSMSLREIELVARCGDSRREQAIFEYVQLLVRWKAAVRHMMSEESVMLFQTLYQKVTGELHNMKGFLRFIEMANGGYYAPFSPDNDIADLLIPHFAERFKGQKFVIHDVKRKKAAIYNGTDWILCHTEGAEIYLSEYEKAFENLWKKYYHSVNIEARPHEKQMKNYMPVRYWKFLPEKQSSDNE
jgi:probable DNA metabolism protein